MVLIRALDLPDHKGVTGIRPGQLKEQTRASN